ncbi:hypothetical protein JZ751_025942 [Albula glossodonta]|uniref:NUAK family SNF1-like kinase 1 n=1 Tax=Albula glossodonta TaxID=121402 RepID=A0A8T2MRU2_9TELE|nr:hypothetical protein JZ751_025942 [Albula glossodonta]
MSMTDGSSHARGLIRWMLMVNPDRRATVEDIANHWWVNWGCKSSVCDCESQQDLGGSPMLARFIDWQNRTEPWPTRTTRPPEPPIFPRQRSRKSKKENSGGGAGNGAGLEEKAGLKRPKGILKASPVGDHRISRSFGDLELGLTLHPQEGDSGSSPDGEEEELALAGGSPPKLAPALPKKGILKHSQQRESGYYSSPERSESSDLLGGSTTAATLYLPRVSSPSKRASGRKGILKRNGKYSTHSGAQTTVSTETALKEAGLSRSQSRPSSIIGGDEGGGLPSSAYRGADWPPTAPASSIRSCVSAEDLMLQMAKFGGLRAAPPLCRGGPRGSPGDNGSFSLLGDLDDVTQVYQQALDISSNLT